MNKINKMIEDSFYEYLNESEYKELYVKAYIHRINNEYNNLLVNVEYNKNYEFVLGVDVIKNYIGAPNKCETNTYNFIKNKIITGENHYYPVGGFHFVSKSLHPVEHWWIYDDKMKKHFEITPMRGEFPWCYGGVINKDINDIIKNSKDISDVDFFRGGYVYSQYFK